MRTVFVNPTVYSRGVKSRHSIRGRRRKRRKNPYILNPTSYSRGVRRSYTIRGRRKNPGFNDIGSLMRETATIAAGAAGGAILNRVGINNITNFYLRNGLRVAAAAALSTLSSNPVIAIAAAGAVLAPIVPEVEMQLAAAGIKKNPQELAADLADLLEADLSDDDLSDDDLGDDDLSDDDVGDDEVGW